MEVSVRQELNSLVEQLTHSGATELNQERMKKVKAICKSSELYVRALYDLVMDTLKENHAEIRLSAFQIANEIFPKSHVFRELLISDFQQFARLVTGTDSHQPLPLPKPAAALLKKQSLLAIREWNVRFGEGYPKLKLGFNFLKHTKKVNFAELVAQSEAARRRREEREGRQRAVTQQRSQEIAMEMREMKGDIEDCMRQMEACFNLLLPRYDLPDIYSSITPAAAAAAAVPPSCELHTIAEGFPPFKTHTTAGAGSLQIQAETSEELGVRKRRRTLSSGSFASLGSSDAESTEDDLEQCQLGNPLPEVLQGTSEATADGGNTGGVLESVYGASSQSRTKKCSVASNPDKGKSSAKYGDGVRGEDGDGVRGEGTEDSDGVKGEDSDGVMAEDGDGVRGEGGDSDSEDSDTDWEDVPSSAPSISMQEHGISSVGYSIPIAIASRPKITENEDNTSIITTLSECQQVLLQLYLPAVIKWLEWMTKTGDDNRLRETIDLKHKLMTTNDKFRKLHIVYKDHVAKFSSKEVSPGIETRESKPKPAARSNPQWKIEPHSAIPVESELDPTTPQAQIAMLRKKYGLTTSVHSSTRPAAAAAANKPPVPGLSTTTAATATTSPVATVTAGLKARAPVVPFGMDLYHWETPDQYQPTPLSTQVGSLHRFWVEEHELKLSEDEKARLKCRAITFAGKFEPVSRSCRAPLASGKLCPRKDRLKCPFHGPIIPRDERGNPVSDPPPSSELSAGAGSQPGPSQPDAPELWEEIQADVMAAKGVELIEGSSGSKRGGRGKRRRREAKYPGLTDLKKHTDTPRKRLERKVLSKRALKSVAASMDSLNAKKFQDKFGYNFNYALHS